MSQPVRIELRAAQPYAGIGVRVSMDGLSGAVDEAFPELFGWLAAQDIPVAGPPFIRYLVIDMAAELQIELAVPVSVEISGSGRIQPGVLPAGRYVTLRHTGPYDGLVASNAALQQQPSRRASRSTPGTHRRARRGAPAPSTTSPTPRPSPTPRSGKWTSPTSPLGPEPGPASGTRQGRSSSVR